jgi:DNA-binding IclR family transcriptional regulator
MPSESDRLYRAAESGRSARARGLDRAFGILKYLRERRSPVRPSEIAAAIGAPKSSVYEVVNSLLEKDILEYVGGEGRIFLGRELHFLGSAYLSNFDLTREAESYLERIAFESREMSQLCTLSGNKYTVVLMKEGTRSFRISSDVGELVPLPWTASGRLLTSHLSDTQVHELIPDGDFILPNGSRLARDVFLAESRAAQEERFFACRSVVDTFTHCFAASVHDERGTCSATLCLIAPKEDADTNFQRYRNILTKNTKELSAKLSGYRSDSALDRMGG